MQIVINIDDNHTNTILTLLKNLKNGIVKDLKIVDNRPKKNHKDDILSSAKGLLKNRIEDPVEYQRELRKEWERF